MFLLKHYTLTRKPAPSAADVEAIAAEPTLPARDGSEDGKASLEATVEELPEDEKLAIAAEKSESGDR